jgi:hypothetical protein
MSDAHRTQYENNELPGMWESSDLVGGWADADNEIQRRDSLRRGLADVEAGRVRPLPWVTKGPDDFEDGGCVTGCTVRVLSCPCGCHERH